MRSDPGKYFKCIFYTTYYNMQSFFKARYSSLDIGIFFFNSGKTAMKKRRIVNQNNVKMIL